MLEIIETAEFMIIQMKKSPNAAKVIKPALTELLRKFCDTLTVDFVSEKAEIEANKIGINLFEKQWKNQPSFDKGRKVFHMEHKYPISDMINDMLAEPTKIEDIINSMEFGWILKTEDALLTRCNRVDHTSEYENANIMLIKKVI